VSDYTTFGPLRIGFDARVLRPREWTTAQSDWAADLLPRLPEGPVLELCAGAGQIGLLAVLHSTRRLVCVDADETACHFARANAEGARMAGRVEVRHSRLEQAVGPDETFPLIIADPPWVSRQDTGQFPDDPLTAIDGGDDGLVVARSCLQVIQDHLAPGGSAILQLGTAGQAAALDREPPLSSQDLALVETREHSRGVLVQIDRPARVA
jgi:release factor glutamine methyltransferase